MIDSLRPLFFVGTPTATALIAVAVWIQRRAYLKSSIKTLGLEPFQTYLANGIRYRIGRRIRPSLATVASLREFAINRLEGSKAEVTVPTIVPRILNVDTMYVALSAQTAGGDKISASQLGAGSHKRILLVGDPGSGKSTVALRIYRDTCRDAVEGFARARVAILIELKTLDAPAYAEESASWLSQLVRRLVADVDTFQADTLFDSYRLDGRISVILDGLDEVPTEDLQNTNRHIIALSQNLANGHTENRLIITMRTQLYVNLDRDFVNAFATYFLQPFESDDIYDFLSKWPYAPEIRDREQSRVFRGLSEHPNIREMCATPLVLAMYVATDEVSAGADLPETRPDFYRVVTDELLIRRHHRQMGLVTRQPSERRERQRIVGRIALNHLLDQSQSRNTIDWSMAVAIAAEEYGVDGETATELLLDLSRDTGLFTAERPGESFRFIHLTFCEFLAAQRIVQSGKDAWEATTAASADDPRRTNADGAGGRFSEVIIFAAALEEKEEARRSRFEWIMSTCTEEIALRSIWESHEYDDEAVRDWLSDVERHVRETPETDRLDPWFRTFRLLAVIRRDQDRAQRTRRVQVPSRLTDFVQSIVGDSTDSFAKLFSTYVRVDAGGAMEMMRVLGIDPAETIPQLLVMAMDEPAILSYALSEYRADVSQQSSWARLLFLASLTKRSINSRLQALPGIVGSSLDEAHTTRRSWQSSWATRGTELSTIMDRALAIPGDSLSLIVAGQVRPRRSFTVDHLLGTSVRAWLSWAIQFLMLAAVSLLPFVVYDSVASLLVFAPLLLIFVASYIRRIRRYGMFSQGIVASNGVLVYSLLNEFELVSKRLAAGLLVATDQLPVTRRTAQRAKDAGAIFSGIQRNRSPGASRIERILSWSPNDASIFAAQLSIVLAHIEVAESDGDYALQDAAAVRARLVAAVNAANSHGWFAAGLS